MEDGEAAAAGDVGTSSPSSSCLSWGELSTSTPVATRLGDASWPAGAAFAAEVAFAEEFPTEEEKEGREGVELVELALNRSIALKS
jgi:hypothetical protein